MSNVEGAAPFKLSIPYSNTYSYTYSYTYSKKFPDNE